MMRRVGVSLMVGWVVTVGMLEVGGVVVGGVWGRDEGGEVGSGGGA